MVSSEAVPYAKTGGLGDMVSSLSLALSEEGHDVRLIIPRYYGINVNEKGFKLIEGPMGVPMGGREEWCQVFESTLPGGNVKQKEGKKNPVKVYFIDHENFFGRDGIYGTPWEPDFLDNARRFTFFSRAAFQLCRKLAWYPDVLHAHDWPSALVPVLLKYGERQGSLAKTVSVLTIHNLGYQGTYSTDNFYATGLGWDVFYSAGFDDWNKMNLLKAGICSADIVNTVSPNYAEETKTAAYGFGLDGILRGRGKNYRGILNGIDSDIWNPAKDPFIPVAYNKDDISGKEAAKKLLQEEFGLPPSPDIPVVSMITRLASQKGVGELFGPTYGSAYSFCRDMRLQFVVLGSGEAWCEDEIRTLTGKLSNFKAKIGFDNKLSHLIEAGSDFFLMPSQYEPCGLNQMYSLAYGTIPIVRNTGGLTDTVENFNQETGSGTGFMFDYLSPSAIYNTVGWAIWAYYNRRSQIEAMRVRGMAQDFSWGKSAREYVSMYEETIKANN